MISEKAGDGGGAVTLRAGRTTSVTGAGQESTFGRPLIAEHEVLLKLEGSRWRVASFREIGR